MAFTQGSLFLITFPLITSAKQDTKAAITDTKINIDLPPKKYEWLT
jgi:hypothetical protein